jgi:hypothetical protein
MADYLTEFCVALELRDIEAERFVLQDALDETDEDETRCVLAVHGTTAYLTDDAGQGGVDSAVRVIQRWLSEFAPGKTVTLSYANPCTKHRPDGFGGDTLLIGMDGVLSYADLAEKALAADAAKRAAPRRSRAKRAGAR